MDILARQRWMPETDFLKSLAFFVLDCFKLSIQCYHLTNVMGFIGDPYG